jgi:hypothetical protein
MARARQALTLTLRLARRQVPAEAAEGTGGGVRAISAAGNWSMALLSTAPWVVAWGDGGPNNATRCGPLAHSLDTCSATSHD